MKKVNTKKLTTMAMMAAIAFLVTLLCHFIMPPLVEQPPLKLDLKDTVIVIAAFMTGPLEGLLITAVVSFIEMITMSSTGIIGLVMNLLQTAAFACTASILYKKLHTKYGAIISLAAGTLVMTGVMILWNWLITPFYTGAPRAVIEQMLLPVFLPFNIIKGGLNTALTLFLYKPVVETLRKSRLLPTPAAETTVEPRKGLHLSAGLYIFAAALLLTCVAMALVLAGII